MNINLLPYLIVWIVLAVTVIALLLYHMLVGHQEDETMKFGIDVQESVAVAQHQAVLEHKLAITDKWGKILTVITVVYGLALAALYIYQTWEQGSRGI
jgi:hypothetical protein